MSETLVAALPLTRWQGNRGTYHLVTFRGEVAEALSMHAVLHRLEFGRARGFGSVKLTARIGETEWRTSVFPQVKSMSSNSEAIGRTETPSSSEAVGQDQREWVLLVSKKVMRAEDISAGDVIQVTLAL